MWASVYGAVIGNGVLAGLRVTGGRRIGAARRAGAAHRAIGAHGVDGVDGGMAIGVSACHRAAQTNGFPRAHRVAGVHGSL